MRVLLCLLLLTRPALACPSPADPALTRDLDADAAALALRQRADLDRPAYGPGAPPDWLGDGGFALDAHSFTEDDCAAGEALESTRFALFGGFRHAPTGLVLSVEVLGAGAGVEGEEALEADGWLGATVWLDDWLGASARLVGRRDRTVPAMRLSSPRLHVTAGALLGERDEERLFDLAVERLPVGERWSRPLFVSASAR